ncbi:SWIM zinc finger family protein [Oxynema sp. CENA135]|uniref:SWIM zinc finger family protein n=1 Tax=Oxynema sp. CENA135 TaxID=984206 RepID=UPI00190C24CF|nr:SWIM zinc finger family protein [Oxynema sp. CENA135]MBK4730170.1 SWIM zinc finger family protein [Oxynema sp. CENA135]
MNKEELTNETEWWLQQWLELINSYRFKKRLERARNYARQGNVLSIEFQEGKAIARVQGTEPEPYQVSLWLDPLTDEEWGYAIETLSQRAIFSAKLLAGEMPKNIEEVFAANGLRLFPFTLDEVRSRCSCPDKANPCKHIAAVYYLLGDRFSEDPFILLQLRGRTKEQILAALRQQREIDTRESETGDRSDAAVQKSPNMARQTRVNLKQFWDYEDALDSSLVVIAPSPSSETVLEVLGPIPLQPSAAGRALMETLNGLYGTIGQQAIVAALNRAG